MKQSKEEILDSKFPRAAFLPETKQAIFEAMEEYKFGPPYTCKHSGDTFRNGDTYFQYDTVFKGAIINGPFTWIDHEPTNRYAYYKSKEAAELAKKTKRKHQFLVLTLDNLHSTCSDIDQYTTPLTRESIQNIINILWSKEVVKGYQFDHVIGGPCAYFTFKLKK
jgi:hypothetical protein